MAILISRSSAEVNQHQHQNGLEWSRNEQNRLARTLEAAQSRANLRNEIGIFQVERGDTLGSIVSGLMGHIDWSQRVDYRSNRITANRPTVLSEANLIYPSQYVWVENNVIIVSDSLPSNTVAPAGGNPVPNTPARPTAIPLLPTPAPVTPISPLVMPPLPRPALVPSMSSWKAQVTPPEPNPFIALPFNTQVMLRRDFPFALTANIETSNLDTNALPSNIETLVSIAERSIDVPPQVPFLISRDLDMESQGAHYNTGPFNLVEPWSGGDITSVETVPSLSAILLNLSGNEYSVNPPEIDSADFSATLLNEFSHSVTTQLVDEYVTRRSQQFVGKPRSDLLSLEPMQAEIIDGFDHPFVPRGIYNFQSYNELQSDAFSMSVFPQRVMGRYLVYGETPLNPPGYDLNRDFTAFNLAEFLRTNGYGDYSMEDIIQIFRSYFNANNAGDFTELDRLENTYHLNDPDFFAFIQPRYQAVGEAFYTHLTNKINVL